MMILGGDLEDLGNREYRYKWQNIEAVRELAKLMAETEKSDRQTPQLTLIERVKQVMKLAKEKELRLTQHDTFALGVAINVCAGDENDRHKWQDREGLEPEQILKRRKIKDEDIIGLRSYWDELNSQTTPEHGKIAKEN